MDSLPKFTVEEYIAYLKAPQFILDGCVSESEYESELCAKVAAWHEESQMEFKSVKDIWNLCYEELERTNKRAISSSSIMEDAIAAAMIPIMKNTMMDEISALYAGQYAPILKPLSDKAQAMVALGNRFMGLEFKLNSWDTLKFEMGVDGYVADILVMKIYTSNEDPGPFGKEYRIVLERIEPRNCYPDPKAKRWHWPDMDYFIVEEEMDIAIARNRFPDRAADIDNSLVEPDDSKLSGKWGGSSRFMMLDGNQKRWGVGSEREKIKIKECWLHDDRMKFRAFKEDGPDGEQVKVDDDGYVEGEWEPYYPDGRMIVTAADKLVLRDIPNPYQHGGLPFEFCPMTPNPGKLFVVGKAASILGIDRKVNDIETRVHSYAQSETERPLQCEMGTFPSNVAWYKSTGQSNAIMVVNQGKSPVRRAPVEVPAFLTPYLGRLYMYKDQTAGQGGILRGEESGDSRLSTEAIQGRMGQAMGRMSMQSVYICGFMQRTGNKMFSLMRQTYKETLSMEIVGPEGKSETVTWNGKEGNDIFVEVDIAANQPGGQAAILQQAITLKRERLADRQYCLQAAGISGWQEIDKRMTDRELEEITAQAYGRALGVSIKNAQKDDAGPTVKY